MSEIFVSVKDQLLKITKAPTVASGGLNEANVIFAFSEQWDGFIKTAVFYRDTDKVYYAVLDENDTCVLPWEVCTEDGSFYFSVFGEKGDTRRTSTIVRYKVSKGLIVDDMMPSDPTPEVYDQIIALMGENLSVANTTLNEANEVLDDLIQKRDSGYFKGEKGDRGYRGYDGVGISYINTYEDESYIGQNRVHIVYTDGRSYDFNVNDGKNGRTPVRGVDYWTEADKAEIEKETVDKCCPTFTESGSVVACEPVEGYPFGVEWKKKNLADPALIEGFYTESNIRYAYTNGLLLPKGTYTATAIADISNVGNFNIRRHDDKSVIATGGKDPITFTLTEPTAICWNVNMGQPVTADNYKSALRVQIEEGTVATAYEPYAETATITRCGKNLLDRTQIVIGGISGAKGTDYTTDNRMRSGYIVVVPGQSYIVSGNTYGIQSYFYYDADKNYLTQAKGGNQFTAIENARYIRFSIGNDTDPHTFTESDLAAFKAEIQIEVGTTATEYEPYKCDTFAIGEPISAWQGVNTIYADVGTVTVTGKADPTAIINKLTNAILSLGGNV